MVKTCLNCKYEPEWSEWYGGKEYLRRKGECKWRNIDFLNEIPRCLLIKKISIDHFFNDNSGVHKNCPVWEEK